MKSPIFIIGPHRAGSTLWHNLIAMCPGVMRLADPMFLGPKRHRDFRFFLQTQARSLTSEEDIATMVNLLFARKQLPGIEAAFWRFEGIAIVDDPAFRQEVTRQIAASDRSLRSIVRTLVLELPRASGYERPCMKFPVDVGHLPELLDWFPEAKVVHITRDPRGLAMSKSNDPSGTALRTLEHPRFAWLIRKLALGAVIAEYRRSARMHLRFQHHPAYQLFQYEDLLADPEKTLRRLCAFIEAPFSEDLLHPEKGRHEHQPSSLTGKRQKSFDPSAAVRWKTAISSVDNILVASLTSGSMRFLSYDPANHPIFQASAKPQKTRPPLDLSSAPKV